MIWIAPFALLITFELIADVLAKEWSLGNKPYWWVLAIAAYCIGNLFWLLALKNGSGLARGAVMFSLASEILAIGVAILYYHESLNKIQALGIVLGIISLVLLFWE